MRMRKSEVDFENRLVHIPDSKTPSGEGDMPKPMTAAALRAFQAQCEETPGAEYLFPSPKRSASKPYITTLKKSRGRRCGRPACRIFRCTNCGTHLRPGSARVEWPIIS
jgi:integrase